MDGENESADFQTHVLTYSILLDVRQHLKQAFQPQVAIQFQRSKLVLTWS